MKTAFAPSAASRRKIANKTPKPVMSSAFFSAMDELLNRQRRDRRKLAKAGKIGR